MTEQATATPAQRDSVVTGGGSGIARSICLRLAPEGLVGVLDRDVAGAEETVQLIEAAGGKAVVLEADVSNLTAVDQAFATFKAHGGTPDIVVACAGVERVGNIIDEPEADWDLVMAVNAKGVYATAKAAMTGFVERQSGSFVVISSDAGVTGANNFAIYCASKFAAVGLVKCLALDYGHLGIRSNVVCPSTVRTPMLDQYLLEHPNAEEYWASSVPLGRLAEPDEVAEAVVFLASPEASYMNGSVYLVDGGATAGIWPELAGL